MPAGRSRRRSRRERSPRSRSSGGKGWQSGQRNCPRSGAGAEIHRPGGDLVDRQPTAQRHIFAKRDQMRLVVMGDDVAAVVDRLEAVPYLLDRRRRRVRAQRAGNHDSRHGGRSRRSRWRAGAIATEQKRRSPPRATGPRREDAAAGAALSSIRRRKFDRGGRRLATSGSARSRAGPGAARCRSRRSASASSRTAPPTAGTRITSPAAIAGTRRRTADIGLSDGAPEQRRQRCREHGQQAEPVDADHRRCSAAPRGRPESRPTRHSRSSSTASP